MNVDPELEAIGIESTVVDGSTIVRVPSQLTLGCMGAAIGVAILCGVVLGGVAWLIGWRDGTISWITAIATAMVAGLLLWFVLKFTPQSFRIRIDDRRRQLCIQQHSHWPASEFAFDEVESIGVDWSRPHGQRASKDAPITYISIGLKRPQSRNFASIDPGGWRPEQRRAFAIWLHKRIAPNARLGQLDAE